MKRYIFFLIAIFSSVLSNGQVRKVTGTVIDENELKPIPGVKIYSPDKKKEFGVTDMKGNFEIECDKSEDELLFIFLGMERTDIKLSSDCGNLEVIMMFDVIYDYITSNKINRKRCKRFKGLTQKQHQAHEKGIFTSDTPCFSYVFHKY
ncbi:MAG: carboxypeptidase-like regulatory domain-containing protein [Flammeovirgaceae bacterium]|nr:carboxypeptidase-like regulatory domain-containing protein [Flammeovirgaceae bacterium]